MGAAKISIACLSVRNVQLRRQGHLRGARECHRMVNSSSVAAVQTHTRPNTGRSMYSTIMDSVRRRHARSSVAHSYLARTPNHVACLRIRGAQEPSVPSRRMGLHRTVSNFRFFFSELMLLALHV